MTSGSGVIIDAGPALTFLARNDTTKVLFQGLREDSGIRRLFAPETVRGEVARKSRQKRKLLGAAENKWKMLEQAGRIEVLLDDETPELSAAVQRLCTMPMSVRMRQRKDLGELMVIAHAAVLAEAGEKVTILIQERDGTAMARRESDRVTRLPKAGVLNVWDTQTVLLRAAGSPEVPDKPTMERLYNAMRPLDAALVPIEQTNLLTSPVWTRVRQQAHS